MAGYFFLSYDKLCSNISGSIPDYHLTAYQIKSQLNTKYITEGPIIFQIKIQLSFFSKCKSQQLLIIYYASNTLWTLENNSSKKYRKNFSDSFLLKSLKKVQLLCRSFSSNILQSQMSSAGHFHAKYALLTSIFIICNKPIYRLFDGHIERCELEIG